jgi:hypothetical protein
MRLFPFAHFRNFIRDDDFNSVRADTLCRHFLGKFTQADYFFFLSLSLSFSPPPPIVLTQN